MVLQLLACSVSGQEMNSTVDQLQYSKETYIYKTVDNHNIYADVYRYPDNESRPAIIWIHGGALIFGTRNWLPPDQLEQYLSNGFTVISIDYRLAPETKLPGIIEDLEDAYAWVRAKGPELFGIDPDRIAIIGHSAGGYLTLMAGFRLKPHPDALVSFYGYGNISGDWYAQPDSFYNLSPAVSRNQALAVVGDSMISSTPMQFSEYGRFQFYLYCRQRGLWPIEVSGHDPDKAYEWYSAYEPLRNITKDYPPTILLHGRRDADVPFEQSVLMANELKSDGVDYQFITNPDWGHGFDDAGLDDPEVKKAFGQILSFLQKYMKR